MRFRKLVSIWVFSSMAILSACGGGSGTAAPTGGNTTELTGQFIDSTVQGLRYVTSSGIKGVTDVNGNYKYVAGDSVEFFVGDVSLGKTTKATGVMTPISLVAGAKDEMNLTVTNIARFLQSLDNDSTPANGIVITADVATAATGQTLAFAVDVMTFESTATPLVVMLRSNAKLAANQPNALVSAADAQAHFKMTLLNARKGFYAGTWVQTKGPGTDSGSWAISIDVQGKVSGCLNSAAVVVSGSVGTSGMANTIAGNTNTGAKFTGDFTLDGKVSGPWVNATDGTSGTYSGNKTTIAPVCSSQQPGGPGGPGGASNVLTLTNGDAAVLGGKLTITERAFRPGLNGSVKTLISTSDGILKYILAILGEIPTPAAQPPAYGVVINTVDIGTEIDISMRVNQNGKSYSYVCGGAFVTKCKNITFDATSRTVTYTNVTVEAGGGDDAQGLLTLNGTLTWMASDAK